MLTKIAIKPVKYLPNPGKSEFTHLVSNLPVGPLNNELKTFVNVIRHPIKRNNEIVKRTTPTIQSAQSTLNKNSPFCF
jgi:hypothetical protein